MAKEFFQYGGSMKSFMMMSLLISASISAMAAADLGKEALKYVPDGKVELMEKDEVKVKTTQGTMVEVEFDRNGGLQEASGDFAQKDNFVPGNGLLSLKDAVAAITKNGKTVDGEWSLDKDFLRDWEYEFEGIENGKKFEYVVNAKTGKLLESKPD